MLRLVGPGTPAKLVARQRAGRLSARLAARYSTVSHEQRRQQQRFKALAFRETRGVGSDDPRRQSSREPESDIHSATHRPHTPAYHDDPIDQESIWQREAVEQGIPISNGWEEHQYHEAQDTGESRNRASLWTSMKERLLYAKPTPPSSTDQSRESKQTQTDQTARLEIQSSNGANQELETPRLSEGALKAHRLSSNSQSQSSKGGQDPSADSPGHSSKKKEASAASQNLKLRTNAKSKRKVEGEKTIEKVVPRELELTSVEDGVALDIPQLSHGLDRVLFNPGVYNMQDPRSGVFNFDPYLASIMPVEKFDFEALKGYTTSSQDSKLHSLSGKYGKKYVGSTSSMTSVLSHLHYLISAWREPSFKAVSRAFNPDSFNFTQISRAPTGAYLRYKNGTYAIDSDKEFDSENILSMLGKSMEKLLTLPKDDFEKYSRTKSHQLSDEERNAEEAYHYTTLGDFLMRSQLDAHDPRLPGEGVFDLKTRAVVSIRMNVENYETGVGYEIRQRHGQWESFDREYCDMIRSAFLKYSLQVRMGRMDGIFVAYHNTQRIFGFQYVSLLELDQAIHDTNSLEVGDQEFKASLALLNDLLDRATKRYPEKSLRLFVETRPTKVPVMYFFVQPVTEEQIKELDTDSTCSAEELESEIRDLSRQEQEAESAGQKGVWPMTGERSGLWANAADNLSQQESQEDTTWEEMIAGVEESIEDESRGMSSVRIAIQEALEHTGLLQDKTPEMRERYVHNLVDALAAHSAEHKESRKTVSDASDSPIDAGDAARPVDPSSYCQPDSEAQNTSLQELLLKIEKKVDDREHDVASFKQALEELATDSRKIQSSGSSESEDVEEWKPDKTTTDAEQADEELADSATRDDDGNTAEIMGMYITVRNRVNGKFINRVHHDPASGPLSWELEYVVDEMPPAKARKLLSSMRNRRRKIFMRDPQTKMANWHRMWGGRLAEMTLRGTQYREMMERQAIGKSTYVAWDKDPFIPGSLSPSDHREPEQ